MFSNKINSTNAILTNLTASNAYITSLTGTTGNFINIKTTNLNVNTLTGSNGSFNNVTVSDTITANTISGYHLGTANLTSATFTNGITGGSTSYFNNIVVTGTETDATSTINNLSVQSGFTGAGSFYYNGNVFNTTTSFKTLACGTGLSPSPAVSGIVSNVYCSGNGQFVYAFYDKYLYVSPDGGNSWSFSNIFNFALSDIATDYLGKWSFTVLKTTGTNAEYSCGFGSAQSQSGAGASASDFYSSMVTGIPSAVTSPYIACSYDGSIVVIYYSPASGTPVLYVNKAYGQGGAGTWTAVSLTNSTLISSKICVKGSGGTYTSILVGTNQGIACINSSNAVSYPDSTFSSYIAQGQGSSSVYVAGTLSGVSYISASNNNGLTMASWNDAYYTRNNTTILGLACSYDGTIVSFLTSTGIFYTTNSDPTSTTIIFTQIATGTNLKGFCMNQIGNQFYCGSSTVNNTIYSLSITQPFQVNSDIQIPKNRLSLIGNNPSQSLTPSSVVYYPYRTAMLTLDNFYRNTVLNYPIYENYVVNCNNTASVSITLPPALEEMIGFTIKFISSNNRGQLSTLLFKASGTNACAISSGTSTTSPTTSFSVSGNCCVMIMLIPSVFTNTAYSYCWTVVSSI